MCLDSEMSDDDDFLPEMTTFRLSSSKKFGTYQGCSQTSLGSDDFLPEMTTFRLSSSKKLGASQGCSQTSVYSGTRKGFSGTPPGSTTTSQGCPAVPLALGPKKVYQGGKGTPQRPRVSSDGRNRIAIEPSITSTAGGASGTSESSGTSAPCLFTPKTERKAVKRLDQ